MTKERPSDRKRKRKIKIGVIMGAIILIVLSLFIYSPNSSSNPATLSLVGGDDTLSKAEEYPEPFISKWNKAIDGITFTAYGESLGCAVQPTATKTVTFSKATSVSFYSYFGSDAYGLVNIYMIADGQRFYIKEKEISQTYYCSLLPGDQPATYIFEYYACPNPESTVIPLETPDGYRHNDLICDHGDAVSRVICKTPTDCSRYSYEEVFQCQTGTYCTISSGSTACILEVSDDVRTTATGDESPDVTWSPETTTTTSDTTKVLYENLQEQLIDYVYDEATINENIRNQQEVVEQVVQTIENNQEEMQDNIRATKTPTSLVFIIVLVFIGAIYGLIKLVKKK